MFLFLDDIRNPSDCIKYMQERGIVNIYEKEFIIVRSYNKFVEWIERNGLPEFVSFDHDLADIVYDPMKCQEISVFHEKTGYDCAKWVVNHCLHNNFELPKWIVHSQNPVGVKNIESILVQYEKYYSDLKLNGLIR